MNYSRVLVHMVDSLKRNGCARCGKEVEVSAPHIMSSQTPKFTLKFATIGRMRMFRGCPRRLVYVSDLLGNQPREIIYLPGHRCVYEQLADQYECGVNDTF